MRIAVDAMGGDEAPRAVVAGAVRAARRLPVDLVLVGAASAIEREIDRHRDARALRLAVKDAAESVGMEEAPAAALRSKPGASIRVAAAMVASGEASGLFSAGNTGATVMAAHGEIGMLPGVDRPALASAIPTRNTPAVLLDLGANSSCRPRHLVQFAVMGAVYARAALGIERPRVGLLSIGHEEGKGNALTREAYRLLKSGPLSFVGNIEARDIYSGKGDVIVCDGFTGNIAIKVSEAVVDMVEASLLEEKGRGRSAGAAGVASGERVFRRLRRRFDWAEYGGAPLLGVAGVCIVGHGRSSARAVENGIAMAARFANDEVVRRIERDIASIGELPT
ncbi:MAG: phosphate acyltransferase PlsX [Vicinamibacterales bacterium]